MIRILKYFKPYVGAIVLVIGLLFAQANADLALPDFMSRIVNVGIQQSGIADSVPEAMRGKSLEKAMLLMAKDGRELVRSSYELLAPSSPSYAAAARTYPKLDGEPLFSLRRVDAATRIELDRVFAPALAALALMEQAIADPARPAAIGARLEGLDAMLAGQMGIKAVRDEYEALGLDIGALQTSYILSTGGLMLLVTFASVAATVLVGLLGARAAAGLARDLRKRVFSTVEGFSFAELDKFSTASLITRSTNDITQVQMVAMMAMRMLFYAPIIGIGGILRATAKASSMWWIIALAVAVLMAIITVVFIVALPRFKSIQALVDRLNLVLRENLSGMMVIRAFAMQGHEERRFDGANRDLTGTMLFVTRVMVVLMPLIMLIMNLVSLLILWTGAHEVAQSQIRIGDMMAFMQYAMQIFFSFLMMSMMFIMLPRASVSADRIAEVLDTKATIVDPESPRRFPSGSRGRVEFREVSFRYPGSSEDVLHKISFSAEPGRTTAVIGTTGAGKSTLVSLIPRFYDVTEGAVFVDGVDVREVAQKELRSRIGFVPQKASLFAGSIESNLRYADAGASDEDIARALDIAQAGEFVDAMPEGAKAEISQGGANVSGGQRQRLAIARALVKRSPIYVFDDSFSALDYGTDMRLRRALAASVKDSAVIVVTQRVATIKHADQILVLDEGNMVGIGTHGELMELCEVYRDIALSQLKEEELA
jgi:ATP-binding cassette subfamily B multidrug efflux pump